MAEHSHVMRQEISALATGGLVPPAAVVLRFGVHTGWVVGHRLGAEPHRIYLPLGDTMSLTRQLQQQAAHETILVSATTARLQRGEARLVRWVPQHQDQAAWTSAIYRLESVAPQRVRLARRADGWRSPLVGRTQEGALLAARFRQAQSGPGQVVHLTAEAGLGKSRLVTEIFHAWTAQGIRVLIAACQPYEAVVPHLPLRSLLRQALGLTEADNPTEPARALHHRFTALGLDLHAAASGLLELLGYPSTTSPLDMLSPESHMPQLLSTVCQILLRLAQHQPLILVLEDMHWCDRTTEAFCTRMVEQLMGAPLLFVVTSRPPCKPPWLTKSYVTQLALPPLDAQESTTVIHATAGVDGLPEPMVQAIVAQAAGNPLFLEELAATMVTTGNGQRPVALPETLHGVLMARLHRLPAPLQHLLMTAAVLGQTWSQALLESIWPDPVSLAPLLHLAQQHEVLYPNPVALTRDYTFKHPLLQQVAYESLAPEQRQHLHAAAGQALEEQYAGRLEEVYEQLAYHYAQTVEHAKAVTYLAGYATQAQRRQAHAEAAAACQQALAHVEYLPEPAQQRHRLRLVLQLAHAWSFLGRFPDSCMLLEQYRSQVGTNGDDTLAGPLS